MKNFVVAVILSVFPISVAQAQTEIKLTLPSFTGLFGLGPKTSVSVMDATPFHIRLVALREEVARFGPGGSVFERYSWEFDYTQLPLLGFVYSDTHCENLIGVAGRILLISQGRPSDWTVQISDINYLDGSSRYYVDGARFSRPAAEVGESQRVDFPRIDLKSTVVVQFANATLYDAKVRLNGQDFCFLRTGEFDCFKHEGWRNRGGSFGVKVDAIFSDNGRFVGYYEDAFSVGGDGPRAYQFILTTQKIRRF